jgi:hypothetical protein
LLLAAESTTGSPVEAMPWLSGVNLSRREKVGRVAATDGMKAFIASFEVPPMPSFLREGITVPGDGLRKRVQMIVGLSNSPMVKITHTKGSGFALLSDEMDEAVFKIAVLPFAYPDMDGVFKLNSFAAMNEDGEVRAQEWEPIGIDSRHLKHCGAIAKILEAGLDKQVSAQKKALGQGFIIRTYSGSGAAPLVFSFDDWPGAVLVMAPAQLATPQIAKETAAIMAPAVKLTLAALRAHATRNHAWAEEATNPRIKAEYEAKARVFEERVAKIVAQTQAQLVIAEERKAAAAAMASLNAMPDPEPAKPEPAKPVWGGIWPSETTVRQPEEDEPEPEPEPTPEPEPEPEGEPEPMKPEIRRTRINAKKGDADG